MPEKYCSLQWTKTERGKGSIASLTKAVADAVRIPVIASGGAGNAQHFTEVFNKGMQMRHSAASIFHFGLRSSLDLKQQLRCRHSSEVPVLIPSIDLMGGKIVQLVQGRKKALEFDNFEEWIERFSKFPLVQLIDLDAAIGTGTNEALLQQFLWIACRARWAGGIRSIEVAQKIIGMGARRVILGSSLIRDGKIDSEFAENISTSLGSTRLVFGIDSKAGKVAIRGWRELTSITPLEMITSLDPYLRLFSVHAHRNGRHDARHPDGTPYAFAGGDVPNN